jgi:adenine-specific DNA glycosylase
LGYYQRAKNLLKGAQFVVEKYNGVIPETREALLEIPGIGPYSSGAILSIAFRKSTAALDGNLIRVYSRFFAIRDDVGQPNTLKKLWKVAEKVAPEAAADSREFAEGMMELGATICTPRNAKCIECPINEKCLSYRQGLVSLLPKKSSKKLRKKHYEEVFLVERHGKIAFFKSGTDSKYRDFSRLPFCRLKKPREVAPDFKYAVTTRDFYVWKREKLTRTIAARVSWIAREKVAELLLPAIDRKVLKTLPRIFEKRADRHGANAPRDRRSR